MITKKSNCQSIKNDSPSLFVKGFSLLELTVVMVVLLTLIGVSAFSVKGYQDWQLAAEAGTKLRLVYSAQRTYLAEHPAADLSAMETATAGSAAAAIIPYLSNGSTALPTVEDLNGTQLKILVDKSPPYLEGNYDPSGSTDDGLWDVGS